jgi:hypothetical protein
LSANELGDQNRSDKRNPNDWKIKSGELDMSLKEKILDGSDLYSDAVARLNRERKTKKIRRYAIAVMISLSIVNCFYFFLPGKPAAVFVYALLRLMGPYVWSAVIVLFMQIFHRFQNSYSRWMFVLWINGILFLSEAYLITERVIGLIRFGSG